MVPGRCCSEREWSSGARVAVDSLEHTSCVIASKERRLAAVAIEHSLGRKETT
jgi:hypothetical protein